MTQGSVQKFLMEVSDMARWYAGTVFFPQLSQFNRAPMKREFKMKNVSKSVALNAIKLVSYLMH